MDEELEAQVPPLEPIEEEAFLGPDDIDSANWKAADPEIEPDDLVENPDPGDPEGVEEVETVWEA